MSLLPRIEVAPACPGRRADLARRGRHRRPARSGTPTNLAGDLGVAQDLAQRRAARRRDGQRSRAAARAGPGSPAGQPGRPAAGAQVDRCLHISVRRPHALDAAMCVVILS